MTIVFQIVLAIVVIIFLVVAGLSSRTWRALHVTAVYFVFFAGVSFAVLAASSLKTKQQWKKQADDYEQQLAEANEQYRKILYGDPTVDQQTEVTLEDARARLTRLSLDRGRVWRQCTPTGGTPNGRRPQVVVATNAPGADPRPNRIEADSILYVFREAISADGHPVPVAYVGEFRVTTAADDQVTITPMHDLENYQMNQMRRSGVTWALYEMMPLDGHRAFVDPNERVQIEQDNISIFGTVDEAAIQEIFNVVNNENFLSTAEFPVDPLTPAQLDKLVTERVRDGGRAEPSDPSLNTFMKVRFLKSHSIVVDYANVQSSLTSQYFDNAGTAISERLKRGEPVQFRTDDIGVLHISDAQPLINDGTCELMERLFIRDLVDYDQLYFEIRTQLRELALLETAVNKTLARINAAEARIDEQFAIRQTERQNLEDDQANVAKEITALQGYVQRMNANRKDLYDNLSKLYVTNNQLASQIAEAHARIQQSVNEAISESGVVAP